MEYKLARLTWIEHVTTDLEGLCSILLSYKRFKLYGLEDRCWEIPQILYRCLSFLDRSDSIRSFVSVIIY